MYKVRIRTVQESQREARCHAWFNIGSGIYLMVPLNKMMMAMVIVPPNSHMRYESPLSFTTLMGGLLLASFSAAPIRVDCVFLLVCPWWWWMMVDEVSAHTTTLSTCIFIASQPTNNCFWVLEETLIKLYPNLCSFCFTLRGAQVSSFLLRIL